MPSCVKSFVLPVAFALTTVKDTGDLLQLIGGLFGADKDSLCAFLAKWLEYTPKLTG